MPANARPLLGPVPSWPSPIRTVPSAPEFHRILGLAGPLRSNRCARLWRRLVTAATTTLERFGPPLAGFTADWELGRRAINSFPHPAPKVGNRRSNLSTPAGGGTRDLMSTLVATLLVGATLIVARRAATRAAPTTHFVALAGKAEDFPQARRRSRLDEYCGLLIWGLVREPHVHGL
jgi:hypothetical protein